MYMQSTLRDEKTWRHTFIVTNHLHLPIFILYTTINLIYFLCLQVPALVIGVLYIICKLFHYTLYKQI